MEKESGIRVIDRVVDILKCFRQETPGLTLAEITQMANLPKATAFRIISTLESNRFLTKGEDQKYYLGSEIARLGSLCYHTLDVRRIALPYMNLLRDLYNESVSLYVVEGNERVCVERVESTHTLRRVINVGDHRPLTRGSSGKTLLAYLPEEEIKHIVAASTDSGITMEQLMKIREKGYTINRGTAGTTSMAAPIFDARKRVVAVLSTSGPSERFPQEDLEERAGTLVSFTQKISQELGCEMTV